MSTHRSFLLLSMVFLALTLTACGGRDEEEKEVAVAVALTQTAAAATPPPATATSTPAALPTAPPPTATPLPTEAPPPVVAALPAPVYFLSQAGQIMRLEPDGQTVTAITAEALPVTDFDVSPVHGRIAYVTGNSLVEADAFGAQRTVKLEDELVPPGDVEGPVTRQISHPRYAPDGATIAFGRNGVNLMASGASATGEGAGTLLLPSDPFPTATGARPGLTRFYRPVSWSPDGARLLVEAGYYPEGSGYLIYDLAQARPVEIAGLTGFPCCSSSWSRDSRAVYVVDQVYGAPAGNLWRIDATTGGAVKLIDGEPAPDAAASLRFFAPHETAQGDLLAFIAYVTGPDAPSENYAMHRITDDAGAGDAAQFTPVRADVHPLESAAWAVDDSGAVVHDVVARDRYPFTGPLTWLPAGDAPAVQLGAEGRLPRWGMASQAASAPSAPAAGPEAAELEALVAGQWELAAAADQAQYGAIEGVHAFPLQPTAAHSTASPLWAVHTYGIRSFDPEQSHGVAIYSQADGVWQELARVDLDGDPANPGPDFLAPDGVRQVAIEPGRIWLQVDGGAGAHGGTYQLLSYDGSQLRVEVASASASPGAGTFADVDGDGRQEVLLDRTEYYVFCYACGVRRVLSEIVRWDGAQMAPVALAPLPGDAPAELGALNERAVALAEAGLWRDAMAAVDEIVAQELSGLASEQMDVLAWNVAHIQLNGQARRAVLNDENPGYPVLEQVFFGDYAAALDEVRRGVGLPAAGAAVTGSLAADLAYSVTQIFTQTSPLIAGTVAEGWESVLGEWLVGSATQAVELSPDLAAAHFTRAWGAYLMDPDSETIAADLQQAATLAPDDALFAAAAAWAGVVPAAVVAPESGATPAATATAEVASPAVATATAEEEPAAEPGGATLTARRLLNVRGGPGTAYAIVGELAEGEAAPITGRADAAEEAWWQIVFPPGGDRRAWVTGDPALVAVSGASSAPLVEAPPTPAAASPAGRGRIFYSAQAVTGRPAVFLVNPALGAEPVLVVEDAVQPDLQPGGQRLAFHSTRDDMLGLGGFDLDTELRVRFSANIEDAYPSWNPEGNRLVFASNREGDRKWRIYLTWADANYQAQDLGFGQEPDWHPSQNRFVFKGCNESGAACGLWTMDDSGAGRQPLTDNPSDSQPDWAPDGASVVFMSAERDGNWELYRLDVASGAVTRLTDDPALDGLPAVSPDGSQVAFVSNRGGAWALWTLPVAGGAPQPIAAIGELPDWLSHGVDWTR